MRSPSLITQDPWERFLESLSPEAQLQARFTSGPRLNVSVGWHLLIVSDADKPVVEDYHSFAALADGMRNSIEQHPDCALLPYYGARAHLARDTNNQSQLYLVHPDGRSYPLFSVVPELTVITDGYLVSDDDEDEETVEVEEEEEFVEYVDEPVADGPPQAPDPDDEAPDAADAVEPADDADEAFP